MCVGTDLLGYATAGELADLLAAKDYLLKHLGTAAAAFSATWIGKDAASAGAWMGDWRGLQARYAAARALYDPAPLLGNVQRQTVWEGILRALTQVDGTRTRGDIADLVERFNAAGGNVDFSGAPQPTAPDPSIDAYKRADMWAKGLEKVATDAKRAIDAATGTKGMVVLGLVALTAVALAVRSVSR